MISLLTLLLTAAAQDSSSAYDADIELVRPIFSPDILPGIDVPDNGRPGTIRGGLALQYQLDPLVLYEFDEEIGAVVANRMSGYLGLSADITRAVTARATIPLHLQFGTQVPRYAADGFAIGDIGVGLHVNALRKPRGGLGFRADVALPTSRRNFYAGERTPRLELGIIGMADVGKFRYATNLSANLRFRDIDTTEEWSLSHELLFHNGFRYTVLPDTLGLGLSVYARFGLKNFFQAAESSGEALLTVNWTPLKWVGLTVSGGRGFTRGYGSTDARVMVQVDFRRLPPVREEEEGFTDTSTQGTGDPGLQFNVRDIGQIQADAENELQDILWEEGELARVDVERKRIDIREAVRFKVNSAELLPESYPILDYIADLMNGNAWIGNLIIEGHASEDGEFDDNFELSERRASSIWRRLLEKGVHPSRLAIRGMGEVEPAGPDDRYDDLQASRRVEFHIARQYESWETLPQYDLDLKYPWNGQPYTAVQPAVPDLEAEGIDGIQPKDRPKREEDDLQDVQFNDDDEDGDDAPPSPTPPPEDAP
jgi:outer membrane protein OmpA-like peptidoglycan-associated protein